MKRIDALDRKMILNFLLVVTAALTGLACSPPPTRRKREIPVQIKRR